MNGFVVRPLVEPGFFRRMFHRPDPENGYIELENLLASRAWTDIQSGDIGEVLRRHGVRSLQRNRAKAMYANAIQSIASTGTG